MSSIFPPRRVDARPVLLWLLAFVLGVLLMDAAYNRGVQARPLVVLQVVDSIPVPPDSLVCGQWRYVEEHGK